MKLIGGVPEGEGMPEERFDAELESLKSMFKSIYVPFYERTLKVLPIIGATNYVLRALTVCLGLFVVLVALSLFSPHGTTQAFLLPLSFAVTVVASALILFGNAYRAAGESVASFARTFTTKEQFEFLRKCLQLMFHSPWHIWFGVVFGSVVWLFFVAAAPGYPAVQKTIFLTLAWLAAFLDLSGLWMAFGAMYLAVNVGNFGGFHLGPIPVKTVGINRIARFFGTLALSLSLQAVLSVAVMYLPPWQNRALVDSLLSLVGIPIFLFAAVFIVVPQSVLAGIVRKDRLDRLQVLEDRLIASRILDNPEPEDLERYREYERMYHTLHATTDIPVDLSTLTKFLSSLMFPLFVFFLENTGRVLRLLRID